jgi:hypothetical protein
LWLVAAWKYLALGETGYVRARAVHQLGDAGGPTVKITVRLATCRLVILSREWAVERLSGACSRADFLIRSMSSAFIDRLSIV